MIRWLPQEDGEGIFKSRFFHDEDGGELAVYANSDNPDFMVCAFTYHESIVEMKEARIRH